MLCIAGSFNDGVLRTIIHYECFPVKRINDWLFIQRWDNGQSFVILISGLDLIHFYYPSAFTHKLLSHITCYVNETTNETVPVREFLCFQITVT